MDPSARVLGEIRNPGDLVGFVRQRLSEFEMTHMEADHLSGLQGGYISKLVCGTKNFGQVSLPCALGVTALKILVVEDVEQAKIILARRERRQRPARTPKVSP